MERITQPPRITTVCLMLKAPVPGRVKTRLAAAVGAGKAMLIYRMLVEHQIERIPPSWHIHISFSPAEALPDMQEWLGPDLDYSPQCEGGLGERLTHVTQQLFAAGCERLIVLGGDCPYIDAIALEEAAEALGKADVVLIPAVDGGYCLIGLKAAHTEGFQEIHWSTPAVYAQTKERIAQAGLTLAVLPPPLEDVDDLESWLRAQNFFGLRVPA